MMMIAGLLARWGLSERVAGKAAPWVVGMGVLAILGLLAWLAVTIADRWHENTITVAQDAGATAAVVAGQNQTLDQLGDANNAEQDLRSAGPRSELAYYECLRNNRNRAACDELRPLP